LQRVLTTVTLLGLLVATAAAFAITEHLKLIRSPVFGVVVPRVFSPTCGCSQSTATIQIRLRHADRVTVTIDDASLQPVRTLVSDRPEPKQRRVHFTWNGRTDSGALAPDGSYREQIHLKSAHRTILFPTVDRIVVDTKTPKVLSATVENGVFSPGGHRTIAIRYTLSERAHAVVYLGRNRITRGRPSRPHGAIKWAGKVDGRQVRTGTYVLSVGALDLAGNETPAADRKDVTVTVRYIDLTQRLIHVPAGAGFTVGVETQAPKYTWRLGRRHGSSHEKTLRLRAPSTHGTYRLVVAEHGHAAVAVVKVRRK
jgi:FlgD Ig-like domain